MSYCLNPACVQPINLEAGLVCNACGSRLLLKDRYRSLQPLGQGGFGRTFLGVDEDLPAQPLCVIKQLYLPHQAASYFDKALELFHQEALRLQELGHHPQIPQLFAHFGQDERFYLVQAWVPGQTLAQELRQQGPFCEAKIWEVLRDLLPVLKFVHRQQIIHRDIKPANIMRYRPALAPQPNDLAAGLIGMEEARKLPRSLLNSLPDRKLVLIDFGVAKSIVGVDLAQTGTIIGSPDYMPPEQTRGKVVPASDLYSLGVTCIHLLTRVPPFELFDICQNDWAWRRALPKGTKVSDRLGQVLDRLLQAAVNQRYQSAAEAWQVVQSLSERRQAETERSPQMGLPAAITESLTTQLDYTKLRQSLEQGRWQTADQLTWTLLCQLLGKSPGSHLTYREIEKLPWSDLQTIDHLWTQSSHGRFGFSVQAQIYQSVEQDYGRFCDRVGWPTHQTNPTQSVFQFKRNAPVGHLPSRSWVGGHYWWRHADAIATKLIDRPTQLSQS